MICNRNRIHDAESTIDADSDIKPCKNSCCEDDLTTDGDISDILTDLHPEGWGEKTDFSHCDGDITIVNDEETLWQALIGEIKTPYGVLPSVGQSEYGCHIWDLMGDNMDAFFYEEFRNDIEEMCKAYPQINKVVDIDLRVGDKGSLSVELTVDSIYGKFNGKERLAWTGSF